MAGGIDYLFKKNKVDRKLGTGTIVAPGRVEVAGDGGTETLETEHILIATGSAVRELPGLPIDEEHIVSSTGALSMERVPERMIVLGAGAIGLEMGSVWSRLGAKVTVVEFLDRVCPGMDLDGAKALQKSLQKQGLEFRMATKATGARIDGSKVHVDLEPRDGGDTTTEVCERLLVAVGRVPYTEGLGLEGVGVELDDRGRVKTAGPGEFTTNVPGIHAIGDVIAGPMLAHKAEEEGVAAVEKIFGHHAHVNYGAIPYVVYTHPELAGVGLTEEDAKEAGHEIRTGEIRTGKFPFSANGRAHAMGETEGFVKVIGDADTDRILGVHIVHARASDMIAEAAVAIEFAGSVEDLALSFHAHPTLPEAVKEASLAALGRAIHI
jgi:dihydrolipoamide dehydrogenase